MTDTAAEFIADTIDVLSRRLAATEQELAEERRQHGFTTSALNTEKTRTTDYASIGTGLREELRDTKAELAATKTQLTRREQASNKVLNDYDHLTLDLYHYIVELAGHRDNAKTKAERVALGHVVERLAEIRGMNDAEREAIR